MKELRKIETSQLLSVTQAVNGNDFIVIGGKTAQKANILANNFLPTISGCWVHIFLNTISDEEIEDCIKSEKKNDMHVFEFYCQKTEHIERIAAMSSKLKMLAKAENVTIVVVSVSDLSTSEKMNPDVLLQVLNSTKDKMDLLVSLRRDGQENREISLAYDKQ